MAHAADGDNSDELEWEVEGGPGDTAPVDTAAAITLAGFDVAEDVAEARGPAMARELQKPRLPGAALSALHHGLLCAAPCRRQRGCLCGQFCVFSLSPLGAVCNKA
jgi:hypothetical protein